MKASKFTVQEKLQSTTKNKFGLPLKKKTDFNLIVVKISQVFSRHVVLWSILHSRTCLSKLKILYLKKCELLVGAAVVGRQKKGGGGITGFQGWTHATIVATICNRVEADHFVRDGPMFSVFSL